MIFKVFPNLIASGYVNGGGDYLAWSEFSHEPQEWRVMYSATEPEGATLMKDNVADIMFIFQPYRMSKGMLRNTRREHRANVTLLHKQREYRRDIAAGFAHELTEEARTRLLYLYLYRDFDPAILIQSELDALLKTWDIVQTDGTLTPLGHAIAQYIQKDMS